MVQWLNEYADLIQIILGFATIVVAILIYRLQRKQESKFKRIEENIKKRALEEEAHKFLMDNEAERDYLPWCVIAANLCRHERHTRKIYKNFCRCSAELQNEILNIAAYSIRIIKNTAWVSRALDVLREDIKKYELGEDYLHDNAKYLHRAFEKHRENLWEDTPKIFMPINIYKQFYCICSIDEKLNISEYMDEFFYHYIGKSGFCLGKPTPPFDYVWESQKLSDADEATVCRWMLDLVFHTATMIHNRDINRAVTDMLAENRTDASSETFEDKYFETMFVLYCTYGVDLKCITETDVSDIGL